MIQRIASDDAAAASEEALAAAAEAAILNAVERLCTERPSLTPIAAAIVASLALAVCTDSRTFSRMFGISHAIVLREIAGLSEDPALIATIGCNERTRRTELALTEAGQALAASCIGNTPVQIASS